MGTLLYDRLAWAQIGDLKITGLRLKFKAEKTLKGDPSTLDLHVYNLKPETRAKLQTKGIRVVVVAGYKAASEVLFVGDSRTIDHRHDGPEWDTHIQCGDGEVAVRKSFSSFSFGPGTSWQDVAKKLAGDLLANTGNALRGIDSVPGTVDRFLHGVTVNGPTVRELDRVAKAAGFEWSIQDGTLQILKPGAATTEGAVLLSPRTGLIGSPDHGAPEKDGSPSLLKAKSLLNAGIRPGRRVKLETSAIRGFYRVEKVVHEGDTHGQEWFSTLEALPL